MENEKERIAESIAKAAIKAVSEQLDNPASEVSPGNRPPQKYEMGERVKACGWVSEDFGKIKGIDWIYHSRVNEYCWGYSIKFEGKGPGLTFTYIPEGYLRKLEFLCKECGSVRVEKQGYVCPQCDFEREQ